MSCWAVVCHVMLCQCWTGLHWELSTRGRMWKASDVLELPPQPAQKQKLRHRIQSQVSLRCEETFEFKSIRVKEALDLTPSKRSWDSRLDFKVILEPHLPLECIVGDQFAIRYNLTIWKYGCKCTYEALKNKIDGNNTCKQLLQTNEVAAARQLLGNYISLLLSSQFIQDTVWSRDSLKKANPIKYCPWCLSSSILVVLFVVVTWAGRSDQSAVGSQGGHWRHILVLGVNIIRLKSNLDAIWIQNAFQCQVLLESEGR